MRNDFACPDAVACVRGGKDGPPLRGKVTFFQKKDGILVVASLEGLPRTDRGFFGFHIHEGDACSDDGFSSTGGHYNPSGRPHPCHAGDLPPLLACGGRAYLSVMTDRFSLADLIGRTVVIHDSPDDFTTQPAGNAGTKIGCGVIRYARRS